MEVTLRPQSWIIISLITFTFSSTVFARRKFNKKKYDPELIAVKELATFYRISGKYIPSKQKKDLKRIKYRLKKSKLFNKYTHFVEAAYQFAFEPNNVDYLKKCLAFTKIDRKTPLEPLFYRKIGRRCLQKFLRTFKNSPENKAYLPLFIGSIHKFLERDIVKDFGQTLSQFKTNSPILISLSNEIKNHYIKNRIRPSGYILPIIIPDPKFTNFIQKNGFLDKTSEKYFHREFKRFLKDIKRNYLQGDYEEIQVIIQNAISFYDANKNYLSNKKTWKTLVILGKNMVRMNQMDLALELFRVSEEVVVGENEIESSFQRLLTFLIDRRINEGMNYLRKQGIIEKFPQLNSKFKFWIARTYELNKEYTKAKQLYLETIDSDPLSFYSILSLERLKKFQRNYNHELLVNNKKIIPKFTGKFTPLAENHLKKVAYFSQIAHGLFLSRTINHITKEPLENLYRKSSGPPIQAKQHFALTIISTLNKKSQYLEAFKLAFKLVRKNIMPLNNHILEAIFPQKFLKEIKNNKSLLDPLVVLSLIRQESAFNPKARSRVGARGLMQILPSTARQYKRRLKKHKLYEPNLNLKIGIKYLEKLIKNNKGNLVFALAAYNAGEGNLARWKKSVFKSNDPIINIEMIPFQETQNYVKLIYRNLYFYNLLAKNNDFLQNDTEENFRVALMAPDSSQ